MLNVYLLFISMKNIFALVKDQFGVLPVLVHVIVCIFIGMHHEDKPQYDMLTKAIPTKIFNLSVCLFTT